MHLHPLMSTHTSASVVLSDQYLSSQAATSYRDLTDLMAITLLSSHPFFSLTLAVIFQLPAYLLLLSNPLCLNLIVYHCVSYTSNRITATGSYSGRSHSLSVNTADIHNYIRERERLCEESA